MTLPYPHKIYEAVTDITPDDLRKQGIRGLLLDIDGTLMQSRDALPDSAVCDWMHKMRDSGFELYVFSNNRNYERVRAFAEHMGLPWTFRARKPRQAAFFAVALELGLRADELAVVGDQTYTDMLGARRFGAHALLVQSTDTYLFYFWPRRLLELPFRRERP